MNQHISRQFDNELDNIRSHVLAMGGLVEKQLGDALKSLTDSDIERAQSVITNEPRVNTYEVFHHISDKLPQYGSILFV